MNENGDGVGLAGAGIEASAGLSIALGDVRDEVRNLRRSLTMVPVDTRPKATGIAPASGPLTLNLGGPELGEVWVLRRMVIGGLTRATVAAGTADVFATSLAPGIVATTAQLDELVDTAAALPYRQFYSSRQIVLRSNENLVVVITGGTNGQAYGAFAQAVNYPERREHAVFDL